MQLANYQQPPFNSTLMGVIRAAADYYQLPYSTAALYGASGHAFMMNVHKELCPSGPYCWTMEPYFEGLAELGLRVADLGFYHGGSSPAECTAVEAQLRQSLDGGTPCMLLNMEFQALTGYDDTGLLCAEPWGVQDVTPGHLTYGSWSEMGGEVHVRYFTIRPGQPTAPREAALNGLRYAADLYARPERHSGGDYAVGAQAWDNWISALRAGSYKPHGNWWNAQVWSECRAQAVNWLGELAGIYPLHADALQSLAADYQLLATTLLFAGDNNAPVERRIASLEQAREVEVGCIKWLAALAEEL